MGNSHRRGTSKMGQSLVYMSFWTKEKRGDIRCENLQVVEEENTHSRQIFASGGLWGDLASRPLLGAFLYIIFNSD